MSHTPQRKEKDCLNCGATVQGKYCHVYGQGRRETFFKFLLVAFGSLVMMFILFFLFTIFSAATL